MLLQFKNKPSSNQRLYNLRTNEVQIGALTIKEQQVKINAYTIQGLYNLRTNSRRERDTMRFVRDIVRTLLSSSTSS